MAEVFKLYKLIVLYMLDKVDFPLTNSQISESILAQGYMAYVKLQQDLPDLLPPDGRRRSDFTLF